ncbi:MAG TPA: tetratricopeptide repeat protein [Candidatus Deferrimicrobium sp.]|nr:tetratricopeptide repeat protein [Candidatus Deferrimicrobium sp.]
MEKRLIIILLVPLLLFWHWFEPAARKNLAGIKAYEAQKYQDALNEFLSAKGIKPDSPALKSNTASSLYQLNKYKEALEEFSQIDPEKAKIDPSGFYYNVGNSFFRLEQFDKALESYKKSLIANPDDMDAKKNYELALKKKEEQEKKDQKDKDQQDQQKQDQKDQQQQQQQQQQEQKHQDVMQYLQQNEKDQLKNKKRQFAVVKKEKDW